MRERSGLSQGGSGPDFIKCDNPNNFNLTDGLL